MIETSIRAVTVALIFAMVAHLQTSAQSFTRDVNPFPVTYDDVPVALPFLGGINEPKPNLVDFDGDGLIDLLIGERTGKILHLRNIGTPVAPVFEFVSDRLGGVDIGSWHVVADIDDDGDLDLFCDNRAGGVKFYRNDRAGIEPDFVLVDSAYADIVTGIYNTPALADIDNDGDLDFFLGGVTGTLNLYRNIGDSITPEFIFETSSYDNIFAFPGGGGRSTSRELHGFSCIHFVDLDDDSALDLLWGDINNLDLYLFANLGSADSSSLTFATETFLSMNTLGFNHPTTGDIDNDGDLDLLIGVGNGSAIHNLMLYRNHGTAANPVFALETANLIDNIDIGSHSSPAVGDIDRDGDLDVLVGRFDGRVTLFENTGTLLRPALTHRTDFFEGIDVGTFAAPVLVDWDGDGLLDLLIGTGSGRIEYWRNNGSPKEMILTREQTQLAGIQVDQYATPRVADLDEDGLLDLVLGEWDFNSRANVLLYRNTGSPGSPNLTLVTATLLPAVAQRDYTAPHVYDWDGDGRLDIIVGTNTLGLTVWLNQAPLGQMPDSTTLQPIIAEVPGSDDGFFPSLVFADFDGDGDEDVLIGELDGGLNFWYRDGSCCNETTGNIDQDEEGAVDIADLLAFVDWLFLGIGPLPCPAAANVNGDAEGVIDLSDLIYLVNVVILDGASPSPCFE